MRFLLIRDLFKCLKVVDFKEPILLAGLNEPSINQQPAFKLKLKASKFFSEFYSERMRAIAARNESTNKFHYTAHRCTVHTNFTSFQIPIHIYDNLLSFKILNEASIEENDLILNPIKSNTIKEIPIQIYNHNPIDVRLGVGLKFC
jgi:hypothetical protein